MRKGLSEHEMQQIALASKVMKTDMTPDSESIVTGVDVAYADDMAYVCAVVMNIKSFTFTKKKTLVSECGFPYIPGYLYLREAPIILDAIQELDEIGWLMIDANGILHPRRMGLASYIGVKLNIPTIGVAKSLLLGTVGSRQDDTAIITHNNEVVGRAVWLGERKKPVYVSIGHGVSLDTAVKVVLESSIYGQPEPIRQAHICANKAKRESVSKVS